ncbi:MAG: dihydroneopterin aldolase [Rhodospirillum sp.]|nr:dihydroneopterin aldolase [Rhodospirillum sp.]MCF8490696.1 dihydroneopterin aldolase [Rhodospirillum sp.]MCF8499405.1 dihydroneopterin aldolase [Rhodospirillum sp.]
MSIPPLAAPGLRHLFVNGLELMARIGVYPQEREAPQRIRISINLCVREDGADPGDDIDNVVSYETLVTGTRAIVTEGHVNLVETLAERIAALALSDPRVVEARVRVEKPDIFPETESVGVEILRRSAQAPAIGDRL